LIVDTWKITEGIIEDLEREIPKPIISARFHQTMADIISDVCSRIRDDEGLNKVVLSGGVFQNRLLLEKTLDNLRRHQFEPFFHQKVPPNDGGICLGQAVIAAREVSGCA